MHAAQRREQAELHRQIAQLEEQNRLYRQKLYQSQKKDDEGSFAEMAVQAPGQLTSAPGRGDDQFDISPNTK